MGGVEDNHDLELDVSDVRQAPVADTPRARQPAEGSPREGAAARGIEPEGLGVAAAAESVEHPAWRPATPRTAVQRMRRYVVAVLVGLVCAGLLLILPDTQQALRQVLVRSTPTATEPLVSGANLVAFEHTAPWGRLTLDGTPAAPPIGQFGQLTALRRGRHILTYAAAPWPMLRCQLSAPARPGDSCPVDRHTQIYNEPLARVLDLGATPDRLPAAQQAALTAAVTSALQAQGETTAVPPGDHYRGADGQSAVATQPLQASLALTLNTDAARALSIPVALGPCVSLCSAPVGVFDGSTAWWVVSAHVVAHWWFVAADGTRIDPDATTDLDAAYPLGATWLAAGGSWSVTAHLYAGTAVAAGREGVLCSPTFRHAFPKGIALLPSVSSYGEADHLGPSEAEGCVIVLWPFGSGGSSGSTATASPTPLPADAALFIVRCGLVLAGNDAAHTAQPRFPVASAHERALAQQWMTPP
jgi:hypothetical protein